MLNKNIAYNKLNFSVPVAAGGAFQRKSLADGKVIPKRLHSPKLRSRESSPRGPRRQDKTNVVDFKTGANPPRQNPATKNTARQSISLEKVPKAATDPKTLLHVPSVDDLFDSKKPVKPSAVSAAGLLLAGNQPADGMTSQACTLL